MATKSFYKNIVISNKTACRNLVSALEKAKKRKNLRIEIPKEVSTVKRSDIKEFFSK